MGGTNNWRAPVVSSIICRRQYNRGDVTSCKDRRCGQNCNEKTKRSLIAGTFPVGLCCHVCRLLFWFKHPENVKNIVCFVMFWNLHAVWHLNRPRYLRDHLWNRERFVARQSKECFSDFPHNMLYLIMLLVHKCERAPWLWMCAECKCCLYN